LEPLFYILAFGLGLSGLIGRVHYGGIELSYTQFIAPALIATAAMWNSFFETTYASFVRMYYQKTFDAILATPLSMEEIIIGEIVWSATKAAGAAAIMIAVLALLGFIRLPLGLMLIPMAFLGGLAFGAVGMFFTGIVPTIDMFNLPIFLFVTPMFLLSGTFFPVANLPQWIRPVALVFPLYHLTEMARLFSIGTKETNVLISMAYLILFFLFFSFLALKAMKKRIIR
jgi:lipooligosaccharide transport system permease protein